MLLRELSRGAPTAEINFEGQGLKMAMINKQKVLNGVGKAVDAANNAADKAVTFAKEKELDKKAKNMAKNLGDGIKSAGESIENLFKN